MGILIHIVLIANARIPIKMILNKKEGSLAHKIQEKKKIKLLEGQDVMGFRNSWKQLPLWMAMVIYRQLQSSTPNTTFTTRETSSTSVSILRAHQSDLGREGNLTSLALGQGLSLEQSTLSKSPVEWGHRQKNPKMFTKHKWIGDTTRKLVLST